MTGGVAELLEMLRGSAEAVGENFESPDDDWMTILAWHDPEHNRGVLAPLMFADELEKEFTLLQAQKVIHNCGSEVVGVVMSSWAATVTPEQAAEIQKRGDDWPKPTESPLRQEMLLIMGKEKGLPIMGVWAEIHRHDDAPPTLGKWEEFGESGAPQGLFADLLNTVG